MNEGALLRVHKNCQPYCPFQIKGLALNPHSFQRKATPNAEPQPTSDPSNDSDEDDLRCHNFM